MVVGRFQLDSGNAGYQPVGALRPHQAFDSQHGQVVLFGGFYSLNLLNDTWLWNGTNWVKQNIPFASRLAPRYNHAMVYDLQHSQMVMFGGINLTNTKGFADTWLWDGAAWTQKLVSGPVQRSEHAMAFNGAVTLKNVSLQTLTGPFSIVFQNFAGRRQPGSRGRSLQHQSVCGREPGGSGGCSVCLGAHAVQRALPGEHHVWRGGLLRPARTVNNPRRDRKGVGPRVGQRSDRFLTIAAPIRSAIYFVAVSSTRTESSALGAVAGRVTVTAPPDCLNFSEACFASASM